MNNGCGGKEDFQEVHRRYAAVIMGRCQQLLKRPEDAGDAFQEICIRIQQNWAFFIRCDSPIAWIYRVTTNTCLNVMRARKARGTSVPLTSDIWTTSENPEYFLEKQERFENAVSLISEDHQDIFVYYFQFGMTQDEIASVIGKSRITVARALATIKRRISGQVDEAANK